MLKLGINYEGVHLGDVREERKWDDLDTPMTIVKHDSVSVDSLR